MNDSANRALALAMSDDGNDPACRHIVVDERLREKRAAKSSGFPASKETNKKMSDEPEHFSGPCPK
jgi:hypothetical protein